MMRLSDSDNINDVLTVIISIIAAMIVAGATDFALAALATLIGLPVAIRRIPWMNASELLNVQRRTKGHRPGRAPMTAKKRRKTDQRYPPLYWRDLDTSDQTTEI